MNVTAGTRLGRYEIRSQIGAGGMGEVYLAQDTKLDRKVALKILPADLAANQQRMRRFVQEAKAASALNHPNILTIYEIDQTDSDHFIATEFIEGETLRQRIQREQMKIGDVLNVAIQTADALTAAHEAGIIHRDIKSENIMLRRRDSIVKVLDFGLAKLTAQPASAIDAEAPTKSLFRTDEGVVLGTAFYMSPEQARGMTVDARSDIWSLGVVLYEMVAGCLPFMESTASGTVAAILNEKEAPPLARFARDVPAELERIVEKALRKDREERYQTAKDLLLDLRRLKQRLEFEAERDRTVAPKLPEALGIIKAGTTAKTETQNSIAILPFANLSADTENEYFCDGLAEELLNALAKIEDLKVAARTSAFSFKGKDADVREIGHKLGVNTVLQGSVRKSGERLRITVQLVNVADGYHLWSARYDRRLEDVFEIQDEISLAIANSLTLKLLGSDRAALLKRYTDNTDAYQHYLKGRYHQNKWTAEGFRKSIEHFNQAIAIDPDYALAYAGLADTYASVGAADSLALSVAETMPKAKAAATRALELDDTLAEAHISLGLVKLNFEWDWQGAERELRRALRLNPNYSTAHHWHSHYLIAMGRIEESLTISKRALELDPLDLEINAHLAWHYYFERDYDRAIEQAQKTVEMDSRFVEAHWFAGWAYEEKGDYDKAIEAYQKAESSGERREYSLAWLGHAYALSGNKDEARKLLERLKNESQQRYVSPYYIAITCLGLNEKEEMFEWLRKACEERNSWLIYLQVNPIFDSLRSDPRFDALVRRVGIP